MKNKKIFTEKKSFCKNHTYFFLKNIITFRIVLLHLKNHNDNDFNANTERIFVFCDNFAIQNTSQNLGDSQEKCLWWSSVIACCTLLKRDSVRFFCVKFEIFLKVSLHIYNFCYNSTIIPIIAILQHNDSQ